MPTDMTKLIRLVGIGALVITTWTVPAAAAPPSSESEYFVPEQWRERIRQLVDPGPRGLPGGLHLATLELGDSIRITYRGDLGELKVQLVPPARAPADAELRTGNMVIVPLGSTLDKPAREHALARLHDLLSRRATNWGWLRRTVDPGRSDRMAKLTERVSSAERAAILGDTDTVVATIADAGSGPDEINILLRLARTACGAGQTEPLRKPAAAWVGRLGSSIARKDRTQSSRQFLELLLAEAVAFSGDAAKAASMTAAAPNDDRLTCDRSRVAEDLACLGSTAKADAIARGIVKAAPSCARAWRVLAENARQAGDLPELERLVQRARKTQGPTATVQIALALARLQAGQTDAALGPAMAAVSSDPDLTGSVNALFIVAHALSTTGEGAEESAKDPMSSLGRFPVDTAQAAIVDAVKCLVPGDHACVAKELERAAGHIPDGQVRYAGLLALSYARSGQLALAADALARAWKAAPREIITLVAEAVTADSRQDRTAAIMAWEALVKRLSRETAPITIEDAEARLAALKVQAKPAAVPAAASPEDEAGAPDEAETCSAVWVGLSITAVLFVGIAFWSHRRHQKSMTG